MPPVSFRFDYFAILPDSFFSARVICTALTLLALRCPMPASNCTNEFVYASSSGLTRQLTIVYFNSLTKPLNFFNISYISLSKLSKYCYKLRSRMTTLDKSLYHIFILLLACSVRTPHNTQGVKTRHHFLSTEALTRTQQ